MKRVRDILTVVVLVASLGANAWFANERLEKKFYQKGITDGGKRVTDAIVQHVQKTGQLNVSLPDGRKLLMTASIAPQPQPTPRPVTSDPNATRTVTGP